MGNDIENSSSTIAMERVKDKIYLSLREDESQRWAVARLDVTQIPELIEMLKKVQQGSAT